MPHVELKRPRIRLFNRKSQLQRLLETVNDTLDVPSSINKLDPRDVASGKALRAGLIATGLAGLTAGSAGISSLRRRREGAGSDS